MTLYIQLFLIAFSIPTFLFIVGFISARNYKKQKGVKINVRKTMAEQDHRTKLKNIAVNLSTQKNEKIKAELWKLFLAA